MPTTSFNVDRGSIEFTFQQTECFQYTVLAGSEFWFPHHLWTAVDIWRSIRGKHRSAFHIQQKRTRFLPHMSITLVWNAKTPSLLIDLAQVHPCRTRAQISFDAFLEALKHQKQKCSAGLISATFGKSSVLLKPASQYGRAGKPIHYKHRPYDINLEPMREKLRKFCMGNLDRKKCWFIGFFRKALASAKKLLPYSYSCVHPSNNSFNIL